MRIEEISITEMDHINVLTDERVFAIVEVPWKDEKYRMKPLQECEINELFSDKIKLIRIVD